MDEPLKITVIAPIVLSGTTPGSVEEYVKAAPPGYQVEVVFLDQGPASVESEYEEVLAAPDVVVKAVEAARRGSSAVVVSCMLDPGVLAAREHLSIPVLGPNEVASHLAAMLGPKFSMVTVLKRLVPCLLTRVTRYGLGDHLASVRSIEVPVLDLWRRRTQVLDALIEESVKAVDQDGAYSIVLGCTGMAGLAKSVQEGLLSQGYDVPVIDPTVSTIKVAAAMASLDLCHSQRAYPRPQKKPVVGYPGL